MARAEDVGDVNWVELICVSRWAETRRRDVRKEVDDLANLRHCASLHLAQRELAALKAAAEAKEVDLPAKMQLAKDLCEAQEFVTKLTEEISKNSANLLPKEDAERWSAEGYKEWIDRLNAWEPIGWIQRVELLNAESGQRYLIKFLESLCLDIPWCQAEILLQNNAVLMGHLRSENVELSDSESLLARHVFLRILGREQDLSQDFLEGVSTLKFQKRMGGCAAIKELFHHCLTARKEVCYSASFAVTPALQLFHQDNRMLALSLKALADSGAESKCFNNPIGAALLYEAMQQTGIQVRVEAIVDFFFIILLIYLGHEVRHFKNPNLVPILLLTCLAIFTTAFNTIAVAAGIQLYSNRLDGFLAAVSKHLTLWNMILCSTDIFSAYIIARFLYQLLLNMQKHSSFGAECVMDENGEYPDACYIFRHPNFFSMLVLFRWTHAGLAVLQMQRIGVRIVPVVHAVSRPASLFFMVFLCMVVLGSFHAYFVFPLPDNDADSLDGLLETFLKIFRLEILSDFDLNELEGLDPQIIAKMTGKGGITGSIEDEEGSHFYHRGIRGEFVILSVLVTVVAMNVYIGLLSELYEAAEQQSNQLFMHFTAEVRYRHLSRLALWERVTCQREERRDSKGLLWLSYNSKRVKDPR
ncbi:unnamed protein product [Effrenium voratum]|nr:unnamed protein product [Effrenium voratum]